MVVARGRHAAKNEVALLQTLLEACGQCEEVPEAHVDIHTGLSGSGVAFVSVHPQPQGQPSAKQGPPEPLQQPKLCFLHVIAFLGLGGQPLGRPLGSGFSPGPCTGSSGPCS